MIVAIAPFPAGRSPTGRTAPVTEILGAGALPHGVERARALSALSDLTAAQSDLVTFMMAIASKPGMGSVDEAIPHLASALLDVFDIERARLSDSCTPGALTKHRAIEALMGAMAQFREDWPRG